MNKPTNVFSRIFESGARLTICAALVLATSLVLSSCGNKEEAPSSMSMELSQKSEDLKKKDAAIAEEKRRSEIEIGKRENAQKDADFWKMFAVIGIVIAFFLGVAIGSSTRRAAQSGSNKSN